MDLNDVEEVQPERCNTEIYSKGVDVFQTHTIRSWFVEAWVKEVAKISGQQVDWHYDGGRAYVMALGDINKVRLALLETLPTLRAMWRRHIENSTSRYMWPDDLSRVEIGLLLVGEQQSIKLGRE